MRPEADAAPGRRPAQAVQRAVTVAAPAIHERGQHLDPGDAVGDDSGGILGQHDQVGEPAGRDRALDLLGMTGVGRGCRQAKPARP
jgi:hypothetical protein